jgi:transposase
LKPVEWSESARAVLIALRLARIIHQLLKFSGSCSQKWPIHVANRRPIELLPETAQRRSRHERRDASSLRPASRSPNENHARRDGLVEAVPQRHWAHRVMAMKNKAPQAAILFDKFHVMRHLGEALDKVRKAEYARLSGKDRRFIKGQKYNLLSRHGNLTLEGKRSLKILLAANKRLNTAHVLKEAFGQTMGARAGRGAFDDSRASLKWQRLGPYDMIDHHWDGIAAYWKPENKVSLGFVEGLNNRIRVFQRRAYGLRDEEYIRLKALTCMLL